jgi:hypothetical protein
MTKPLKPWGMILVLVLFVLTALIICDKWQSGPPPLGCVQMPSEDGAPTPRKAPRRFPPNTSLPRGKEVLASGPVDSTTFNCTTDVVRLEDSSVWWESDHDENDNEDDHLMHRKLKEPLERLIASVSKAGGRLKVYEAYRPSGIHKNRSLHREGRALDATCDEIGLQALAKLCWLAGFDWVYYEANGKNGEHIHCSVRR